MLDVTEEEANKLLASVDPLSAMAGKDDDLLRELLADLHTESDPLRALFDELLPESPVSRFAPSPEFGPAHRPVGAPPSSRRRARRSCQRRPSSARSDPSAFSSKPVITWTQNLMRSTSP